MTSQDARHPLPVSGAGAKLHDQRAYSVQHFCCRYAVGRTKAYAEIAAGRLRAVKVGRHTLIAHDAAEAWLAALPALNALRSTPNSSTAIENVATETCREEK